MGPRDPPVSFPTPHGHEPGPCAGVLAANLQLRRCVNPLLQRRAGLVCAPLLLVAFGPVCHAARALLAPVNKIVRASHLSLWTYLPSSSVGKGSSGRERGGGGGEEEEGGGRQTGDGAKKDERDPQAMKDPNV
jgi:hypothetical protein